MIYIYRYSICGHRRDTYYRSRSNAKNAMREEAQRLLDNGWKPLRFLNYFDATKGIYIYEKTFTKEGLLITQALIEGHFAD